jgi:hypothetical protein
MQELFATLLRLQKEMGDTLDLVSVYPKLAGNSTTQAKKEVTPSPTRVSLKLKYVVTLTNDSDQNDNRVTLSVKLPESVSLSKFTGPTRLGNQSADWRQLEMQPITSLRPNESVHYTIVVESKISDPSQVDSPQVEVESVRQTVDVKLAATSTRTIQ